MRSLSSQLRSIFDGRPAWINALMVFCGYMTLIYLPWAYLAIGAVSSVFAFRAARAINRYVAARYA